MGKFKSNFTLTAYNDYIPTSMSELESADSELESANSNADSIANPAEICVWAFILMTQPRYNLDSAMNDIPFEMGKNLPPERNKNVSPNLQLHSF